MAKSPTEQIRELNASLGEANTRLELLTARVADLTAAQARSAEHDQALRERLVAEETQTARVRAELDATKDELRRALERIAVTEAKNAALEERARGQEKTTDRGWQLWLAVLAFGFSLISLLVTAALQLKK